MKSEKQFKKLLRRNSLYLILFFSLIGLTQCVFEAIFRDTKIKPEVPPYFKIGDTLIYHSELAVDSFYVEKATLYAPGQTELHWNYEVYLSTMTQFNCSDSCYEFRTSIDPTEYRIVTTGVNYSSYELVDYGDIYANLTLKIGKYQLNEIFKSYNIKADSITGKEIRTVYYSKKYGVVEYELTNGGIFDLDEACITMMEERHNAGK